MPDPPSPDWQPKAIIFDLLTALLNSWATWDKCTPARTQEEGRRWRARYLELTFGAGAYHDDAGAEGDNTNTSYEHLVRRAAADAGLPSSAPEALLRREWAGLEPWPEAGEVLRRLSAKGRYELGVVTNCSAELGGAAVRIVEGCVTDGDGAEEEGLFAFDAVVTAEESGFYKPVRAAYEAVLAKLGVAAEDVLFVAGSAGDVQGATEAGMKVVWHNRVGLARKGDAVPLREGRNLCDVLGDFL